MGEGEMTDITLTISLDESERLIVELMKRHLGYAREELAVVIHDEDKEDYLKDIAAFERVINFFEGTEFL